jgi:uncharacterized protein (TIGR03067 family)
MAAMCGLAKEHVMGKRSKVFTIALFAVAGTAVLSRASDDDDRAKLVGRWEMTGMAINGKPLGFKDKIILTFSKDGKVLSEGGPKGRLEGTYKIDPDKNPKQIDMTKEKEDTAGVYLLEGDTLKIGLPIQVKKDTPDKPAPATNPPTSKAPGTNDKLATPRPMALEADNVITITFKREAK